jgi:hypothetical protein
MKKTSNVAEFAVHNGFNVFRNGLFRGVGEGGEAKGR